MDRYVGVSEFERAWALQHRTYIPYVRNVPVGLAGMEERLRGLCGPEIALKRHRQLRGVGKRTYRTQIICWTYIPLSAWLEAHVIKLEDLTRMAAEGELQEVEFG